MIFLRRDDERYCVKNEDQETLSTFNPQDETDPLAKGFGGLERFEEDRWPPGAGAEPHLSEDAEIITYVHDGTLAQGDSTGESVVINTGEFQGMTTGCRIYHSERNALRTGWAHVFRMSLHPSQAELACAREQKFFTAAERRGMLRIVASQDGRKGSLRLHQDVRVYSSMVGEGQHLVHSLELGRVAWLHVVCGRIKLDNLMLATGDGVGVKAEPAISFTAQGESEILLIDLPEPASKPGSGGGLHPIPEQLL